MLPEHLDRPSGRQGNRVSPLGHRIIATVLRTEERRIAFDCQVIPDFNGRILRTEFLFKFHNLRSLPETM